jgi:hypothetical protein
MATVKLSSSLPDEDQDLNGLEALRNALLADPRACHYVVGIVDCSRVTTEFAPEGEGRVPTVRFVAIEPLESRDSDLARALMDRAHAMRTGRDPLPIDFGEALRHIEGDAG